MRRTAGILFGVLTRALSAFTVWHLVWFLKGAEPDAAAARAVETVPGHPGLPFGPLARLR